MTATLITGGGVKDLVDLAERYLERGDKVILFHAFPEDSFARAPAGAEIVFNLDPDGLSSDDIADIYGVQEIINLDHANPRVTAPQHLY